MAQQIVKIRMQNQGNQEQDITDFLLACEATFTKEQMIHYLIQQDPIAYYIPDKGKIAKIAIAQSEKGTPYIKTDDYSQTFANLLSLPRF